MRQVRYIEIRPRPGNLLAQIIGLIVGLGVLIVSVVLGAFLLAAFLGFVMLVAIVLYGRFWWLRRRMMRERQDEFIETEYRVVDDSTRPDRRA